MYRLFCDGNLLYDPRLPDYAVDNLKADLELNKTGSLSFDMPPGHPMYNSINKMKSELILYQDEEFIAAFRPLEFDLDFDNVKTVSCEGELAYLLDSKQRPAEYHGLSVYDYFTTIIANHNADVNEAKRFTLGSVTVTDPNDSIYRAANYENTWDTINDKLIKSLGGYVRTRRVNGQRLLDYVAVPGSVNTQVIRFGENLVTLARNIRGDEIATVLIPLGAETEGERLTIASVNSGRDYVEDAEAIALYGRIVAVEEWDDVTLATNLIRKGRARLQELTAPLRSVTLTAVDLSLLDASIDRFRLGDSVRVLSSPHGLDTYMTIQKLHIEVQKPESSTITLGAEGLTLESALSSNAAIDSLQHGQQSLSQQIASVRTSVRETKAALTVAPADILATVSESYVTKDALTDIQSDFRTSVSQTAQEIRLDFNGRIAQTEGQITTNQKLFDEYIRFRGALIELGKVGNAFTAELSNERLSFLENGAEIAYISNQTLVITDAEIQNRLSLGDYTRGWFDFIPRPTGNLSMVWRAPEAIVIIRQPQSVELAIGETATFTVEAYSVNALSYKWYYKNPSGTSFKADTAQTTASYSIGMTSARNGRLMYCVITDTEGNSVQTETVSMTVPA